MVPYEEVALVISSNLSVMQTLQEQINILEQAMQKRAKLRPEYAALKSIPGIGTILALTNMPETGPLVSLCWRLSVVW